ncbi:MAG: CD225/dispanin family protein [Sedimentisphaerales bacterium]|nr:CD225/dispanin family protein [Sedimentisphaerales bacterium]
MYCRKCGAQNDDNAFRCVSCGEIIQQVQQVQQVGGNMPYVPNYLVHAILATIFCCVPFGIVSIVYAAQVNGKLAAGDYDGAVDSSNKAKTWFWVSFGIGLAVSIMWFFFAIIGALAEA